LKTDKEARKATELEAKPEKKESEAEYEKVFTEQAAVKPVGGLRKRHRGLNLAAELPQIPKERSRGSCGSRKELTVAGRDNVVRGNLKRRTFGRRHQPKSERKSGIRTLGLSSRYEARGNSPRSTGKLLE
jgi:hypothetical protein